MIWQVTYTEILAWLATSPSPVETEAVLGIVRAIAADPYGGVPVASRGLPVFTWPVPGTYLNVSYVVVEQFRTVKVIAIGSPAT